MAKELCAAGYRAEQVPGAVVIFGSGSHKTAGYKTYFEQMPIRIYPPQFALYHETPNGPAADVVTEFTAYTLFRAAQKIDTVTVHDSDGAHEVRVEQVPDVA